MMSKYIRLVLDLPDGENADTDFFVKNAGTEVMT